MKRSLTKSEIAEKLANTWGCSEDEAKEKFTDVLDVIEEGLVNGDRVYLDNLGTLNGRLKPAQPGKFIPGLGKRDIPAHIIVDFEPSDDLVEMLEDLVIDSKEPELPFV